MHSASFLVFTILILSVFGQEIPDQTAGSGSGEEPSISNQPEGTNQTEGSGIEANDSTLTPEETTPEVIFETTAVTTESHASQESTPFETTTRATDSENRTTTTFLNLTETTESPESTTVYFETTNTYTTGELETTESEGEITDETDGTTVEESTETFPYPSVTYAPTSNSTETEDKVQNSSTSISAVFSVLTALVLLAKL
ncbi:unnamed protein product [Caenorhabditis angaria]|uniref:Uncharacterized protein n=1 Tax=Caenorhabditis angaria TaxID=860376 RepID=A0A9P1N5K4_9PELO|nr:unnamed protein product [Caenorhabditis angaria]